MEYVGAFHSLLGGADGVRSYALAETAKFFGLRLFTGWPEAGVAAELSVLHEFPQHGVEDLTRRTAEAAHPTRKLVGKVQIADVTGDILRRDHVRCATSLVVWTLTVICQGDGSILEGGSAAVAGVTLCIVSGWGGGTVGRGDFTLKGGAGVRGGATLGGGINRGGGTTLGAVSGVSNILTCNGDVCAVGV